MKNEKQGRRDRNEWRALVAEWRASGAQASEFARRRGLKVANLYYWSSVLGREAKPAARLVPVQLAPSTLRTAELELVVGAARIRFQEGARPTYIAAVEPRTLS
jgi:hypothetical protein